MKEECRFSLRLPKQIFEMVKKMAEENDRSINSEIINILKKAGGKNE